jgi:hypothetical protein
LGLAAGWVESAADTALAKTAQIDTATNKVMRMCYCFYIKEIEILPYKLTAYEIFFR